MTGPGQTLFHFVRHWSRRCNALDHPELAERGSDVTVTEAVHALRERAEVTVNDVAAELGIDQSGASRMIAAAAGRGLLATRPSPTDARRKVVTVTAEGAALLADAHEWQERAFAQLTRDWTDHERAEFHRAMTRLVAVST